MMGAVTASQPLLGCADAAPPMSNVQTRANRYPRVHMNCSPTRNVRHSHAENGTRKDPLARTLRAAVPKGDSRCFSTQSCVEAGVRSWRAEVGNGIDILARMPCRVPTGAVGPRLATSCRRQDAWKINRRLRAPWLGDGAPHLCRRPTSAYVVEVHEDELLFNSY
jgi:hypothetical protein